MGIELKCKKNGETYSMRYSEFNEFRRILANTCNPLLCNNYIKGYIKDVKLLSKMYDVDERIVDFLMQSDCDGRISPDVVELIYTIIADNSSKFLELENIAYFHNFLLNCLKNNSDMVWY